MGCLKIGIAELGRYFSVLLFEIITAWSVVGTVLFSLFGAFQ